MRHCPVQQDYLIVGTCLHIDEEIHLPKDWCTKSVRVSDCLVHGYYLRLVERLVHLVVEVGQLCD
jgi:hypothetical protein